MHDENKSLKDSGFCDASENPPMTTPNTNSTPRTQLALKRQREGDTNALPYVAATLETELQSALREVEGLGNDLFEKQSVITELAGRAFTAKQEYDLLRREVEELKRVLGDARGAIYDAMLAGHLSRAYHDNVIEKIDNAMKEEK